VEAIRCLLCTGAPRLLLTNLFIHGSFNAAFGGSDYVAPGSLINNEQERTRKERVVGLRLHPGIWLKGLRKATEILSHILSTGVTAYAAEYRLHHCHDQRY
jgi:hypothetical protein